MCVLWSVPFCGGGGGGGVERDACGQEREVERGAGWHSTWPVSLETGCCAETQPRAGETPSVTGFLAPRAPPSCLQVWRRTDTERNGL